MLQINKLREKYLEDGFIVIKSMYSKEYIRKLRPEIIELAKLQKENNREILLDKNVQDLLINNELIKIINKILDTDNLLYYSDSDVINHSNPFKSTNGFHHDARGEDPKIPYDKEYPIVRVGIYFEDYKNYSGGLKIKKKSHKYFCFNFRRIIGSLNNLRKIIFSKTRYNLKSLKLAKSVNLELEEGDIVIWNLKTHHCGTSRRLKFFPKYCLQPNIEKLLPTSLYLPTQYDQDRCSIFATYAKNDLNNKNILGYLKIKANEVRLNQIKSDQELLNKINQLGCKLPDQIN